MSRANGKGEKLQRTITYLPLLPRIKQSPYFDFNCPSTYSSVCSIAIFIYPSKQANTPDEEKGQLQQKLDNIVTFSDDYLHIFLYKLIHTNTPNKSGLPL